MRGIWGTGLVLVVGCAPAAPRPSKSSAPEPTPAPPPAAVVPHPARWSGLPAFTSDHHPLPVGSDLLYLGAAGRRLVLRSDGFAEATQLAPEPLVAVRAGGSAFRFFGAFGAIYESEAPLSTFSTVQAGVFPFTSRPELAVGQRNAVAIGDDGRLYVSKDGARFQQVDKQAVGIPAWAKPRHVAMNGKGEGALVATPQRLFRTKDDGKTWQATDPPAGGLAGLGTGASGDLFARSIVRPGETMHVDGTLYSASAVHVEVGASPPPRGAAFVDDRLVLFDKSRLEVVRADGVRIVTKLTTSRIEAIGGSGLNLVAIGPGEIHVSHDGGHFDESLPWNESSLHERPRVRVEGSSFVVANCDKSCSSVSARASGGPLHDVAPVEAATVLDVALSRGTLYLLGHFDGKVRLYAGPPSAAKLARFGTLDHPTLAAHGIELAADDTGVRALVSGWWRETVFLAVDVAGTPREPVRIPYAFGAAALAGMRGLAKVSSDSTDHLVETMDGGAHWTPVGGPAAAGTIDCTALGCTLDGVARFGWDLPAPTDGPREEPVASVGPKSTLTCARKGPLRKVSEASVRPLVDANGLRLVVIEAADAQGQTLEVLGQKPVALAPKAKLSKKALLGFEVHDGDALGRVVVTKADVVPGGVLATRAHVPSSVKKPESLGPVGLEVFWWSRATGKVRTAELGTLPPFRVAVSSSSLDVEAVVLADDSLLLHPDAANTAWLVAPDGKARMLSFPQTVRLRGAARAGSLLRFAGNTAAGEVVGLFDAQGLTHTVGWNLGEASAALATIGGVPYLATPEALFSLEDLSSSVPDPILRGAVAPTCPSVLGPIVEQPADPTFLLLEGEDAPKLRAHLASVAVDAKGHSCLVARSFHGTRWKDHSQAWVGGGGGWLLRDGNLQALACNP